jgi:hypothetical protein
VSEHPIINWTEADKARSARWRSESGMPLPKRVVIADNTMKADHAYRLACEGTVARRFPEREAIVACDVAPLVGELPKMGRLYATPPAEADTLNGS